MKVRPILFSGPMVRALLDGTKTQTRRPVKPGRNQDWLSSDVLGRSPRAKPVIIDGDQWAQFAHPLAGQTVGRIVHGEWSPLTCIRCPYGQPGGDRLYVRETWAAPHAYDHLPSRLIPQDARIHYAATEDRGGLLWRPSIHMPRWASRLTLRITDVRVQRLQDISEDDALSEGVTPKWEPGCSGRLMEAFSGFSFRPAASAYADLWESINGPGSWEANSWVWCVSFETIKQNVDAVLA